MEQTSLEVIATNLGVINRYFVTLEGGFPETTCIAQFLKSRARKAVRRKQMKKHFSILLFSKFVTLDLD